MILKVSGNPFQNRQIDIKQSPQTSALHLNDDFFSRVEFCLVNLSQTRGCQGQGIEVPVEFVYPLAEILLDNRGSFLVAKSRNAILEFGEFFDIFGRKQVGTGGKKLTQLDKRRTQIQKCFSNPNRLSALSGFLLFFGKSSDISPSSFISPLFPKKSGHERPNFNATSPARIVLAVPAIGLSRGVGFLWFRPNAREAGALYSCRFDSVRGLGDRFILKCRHSNS